MRRFWGPKTLKYVLLKLEAMAAESARISQSAAAGDGIEHALMQRADEVSEALRVGAESKMTLHNPWNLFQH